jgi:ParB-like chromosome segregation protein Spo0J
MAVDFKVEHKRTSEYRLLPENITIRPDLNGRFDKPDIEWLITDILAHGQHTPVVIRNDGGAAVLVSGFSRWRAVSEINKRGLVPAPGMQLRATAVSCNEAEAFILNISENRFRNPTTAIDDAHNIKRLLNIYAMTEDQVSSIYFPTAKTESELKEARRFVKDRIALIDLVPEAETAVREGRVTESAAKAIAKLPSATQREIVSTPGNIERRDVAPTVPKAPKPAPKDAELLRRIAAMFEDISGLLHEDFEYIEVERKLLISLNDYVEELKKR